MRGGRWVEINEPMEEQKNFLREVVIKGLFGRNAVHLGTAPTTTMNLKAGLLRLSHS